MSTTVVVEGGVMEEDPKSSGSADGEAAGIKALSLREPELSPRRQTFSQIMEEKRTSLLAEAKTLCDKGAPKLGVRKLTKAIVLNPTDPELFRLRAEACVLAQDYHTAILNFKKVISMNEEKRMSMSKRLSLVYYQYGTALFTNHNHTMAAEMFQNSVDYDPSNKEAVARRMECLIAMHKYSECMDVIQKEVQEDDSNPDLFVVRAQMNLLFGQTSDGYGDVCKALELKPDHTEALEMKEDLEKKARQCKDQAVHKSLLGKNMDALRKLNNAIEIDPGTPEYFNLRGTLYRKLGDFNAAVDDFLLAMSMCGHREDSPVYKNASKQLLLTFNDFALECFKQKQYESAVTLLNKAIRQEKGEKGLYSNRGDCFYRMGNLQFALSDYQQALELNPGDWELYCRVGVVCCEIGVELFARGNFVEAEQFFSAAIQHNPKVSWFYNCRARAKYELKDISGAKEDILFAIVLDPRSDECLSLIPCLYLGKSKEDLLSGYEALRAQIKLRAVFKHTAVMYTRASQRHWEGKSLRWKGRVLDKAASHLDGIDLKVTSEQCEPDGKLLAKEGEMWLPPLLPPPRKSVGESSRDYSIEERAADCKLSIVSPKREEEEEEEEREDEGAGKEEGKLKPREWAVLSRPLPELPDYQHGILTMLQTSAQEEHFHKSIYYTKRKCDLELEKMLQTPPDNYLSPTLPKIHDLGRTTLTGNTLIK